MDIHDLDTKWNSLKPDSQGSFTSLRLSADCIPDLYVGIDANNVRCLILKLPERHSINFASVIKQNISVELFRETNWIILKLSNSQYKDLFNDLIISLYSKVKMLRAVNDYTTVLIEAFYRWNEFFDDSNTNKLSEEAVMGLSGELCYLAWEIENSDAIRVNEILSAWQGPFDKGNDFIFGNRNIEVKTRQKDILDIRISSEFQLQPEAGKDLRLVVITVVKDPGGVSLRESVDRIRNLVVERLGDFSILLKALHQKGLTVVNIREYDHLRFRFVEMTGYDCMNERFPKITIDTKPRFINNVKYNIRISELDEFIIDRFQIE